MEIEEIDLISFFESIPIRMDDNRNVPFYYNFTSFEYEKNLNEKVKFAISPASGEIQIVITSNRNNTEMKLENVNSIIIKNDTKDFSDMVIKTDFIEVYLAIKPTITIRINEYRNI